LANRKKPIKINFRVNEKEKDIIDFKIKQSNLPKGEFLRNSILKGYVHKVDSHQS
jgi:hypothetical protein